MALRGLKTVVLALAILSGPATAAAQGSDIVPVESLPALGEVEALLKAGRAPEAQQKLQQIQQANPERPEPHVFFGQQVMGQSPPAAAQQFQQALALDPGNVFAVAGLARLEANAGQAGQALTRLDAAAAAHPQSVELKAARADIHIGQQNWAEAEAALDGLLALQDRPANRLQRGDARYQQQKLPEALADYEAVAATAFGSDPQYAPMLQTRISTVRQALPKPLVIDASNRMDYFTFVSLDDFRAPDLATESFNCRPGALVFATSEIKVLPDIMGLGMETSTAPVRIVGEAGTFGTVTLVPNIVDPNALIPVVETVRMTDPSDDADFLVHPAIRFCPIEP